MKSKHLRPRLQLLPLLALLLVLCLSACTPQASPASQDETPESSPAQESQEPSSPQGYTFDLPDGWQVSQDNDSLFLPPDYPENASSINVVVSEKDPSFSSYDIDALSQAFQTQLEASYADTFNEAVEVTIESCAFTTVGELPAIRLVHSCTVGTVALRQLQYVVDGDQTYTFTFTQCGDVDLFDAFEASAATIQIG